DGADAGAAEREPDRGGKIRIEARELLFGEADVAERDELARAGLLDRHTDQGRQALAQTGELRPTARHDDAQQRRRAGLVPVVVDRAADFVEKHRQRSFDRAASTRYELVVTGATELTLQRLRGLRWEVEVQRDRVGQFASTGT